MKHANLEAYFLTQDIVLSDDGLDKIVEAVLADQAEQVDERREYTIKENPQFETSQFAGIWLIGEERDNAGTWYRPLFVLNGESEAVEECGIAYRNLQQAENKCNELNAYRLPIQENLPVKLTVKDLIEKYTKQQELIIDGQAGGQTSSLAVSKMWIEQFLTELKGIESADINERLTARRD